MSLFFEMKKGQIYHLQNVFEKDVFPIVVIIAIAVIIGIFTYKFILRRKIPLHWWLVAVLFVLSIPIYFSVALYFTFF